MIEILFPNGKSSITINSDTKCMNIKSNDIWNILEDQGLIRKYFYSIHNGRLLQDNADILGNVILIPRVSGGKGGFGSMLRAIGAQIEKTTNREACRDLSGRRLRDINEEKRLQAWIEKGAHRETVAIESRKKKLERLWAKPSYEFKDKVYECERSRLGEKIDNSVEEGLKIVMKNHSSSQLSNEQRKKNKRKIILDDISSDNLVSSNDEYDVPKSTKKIKP